MHLGLEWIQASLDEKSQSQAYVSTGSATQKARREMEERGSIGRDQGQQQHGNGRAVAIADGDVIEMEAAAASTVASSSGQQGDDAAGGVQVMFAPHRSPMCGFSVGFQFCRNKYTQGVSTFAILGFCTLICDFL